MAKKNETNNNPAPQNSNTSNPAPTLPEGFDTIDNDITAFWDGASDIYVKPLHANLSDNGQDPQKVSTLVVCELMQTKVMTCKSDDGEAFETELAVGTCVGLWLKPGFREILNQCGATVYIAPKGEKPVKGRSKPMKTFMVGVGKSSRTDMPVKVSNDYRDKSRNARTVFDAAGDETIPF